MCDTFRPLHPTKAAVELDDADYPASWSDAEEMAVRSAGQHHPNGEPVAAVPAGPRAVDTSG